MKKTVWIGLFGGLLALLLVAGTAFGQTGTLSIQNEENAPFYFVVDPPELAGLTAGSPLLASRVATFFTAQPAPGTFSQLDPGAEVSLSLADGAHLLVGFFAVQDLADYPVRVVPLQADSRVGERFYAVFASPSQLTVPRGSGRVSQIVPGAAGGTTAAASGQSATSVPRGPTGLAEVAGFTATYDPVAFTRETSGGFSVLPLAQSRAWPLTGTRLSLVSALLDNSALKVALTVRDGFAENVSYFLYFFQTREEGAANALTLEIEPRADGSRGACLLWRSDLDGPRLIGDVKTIGNTVELTIGAQDLAGEITSRVGTSASMDLTSGWYDRALGTWEEFYYTSLALSDFPATR